MVESHSQPASPGSEPEIETGSATQSITILGLQFNVRSPYSAGHVCTKGEARALNQKRLESIRNHFGVKAKDGALAQADVDAYAASYVFGERTARHRTVLTDEPGESECLARPDDQPGFGVLQPAAALRGWDGGVCDGGGRCVPTNLVP